MPALSQNFIFIIDSQNTVSLNYPNTGTSLLSYSSEPIKGNGYFNNKDGYHSIQMSITDFVGTIEVQGSLSNIPTENDWFTIFPRNFTIDTTGGLKEVSSEFPYANYTAATSNIKIYNFIGNYVWLRSKISNWSQGSINSIKINY